MLMELSGYRSQVNSHTEQGGVISKAITAFRGIYPYLLLKIKVTYLRYKTVAAVTIPI